MWLIGALEIRSTEAFEARIETCRYDLARPCGVAKQTDPDRSFDRRVLHGRGRFLSLAGYLESAQSPSAWDICFTFSKTPFTSPNGCRWEESSGRSRLESASYSQASPYSRGFRTSWLRGCLR